MYGRKNKIKKEDNEITLKDMVVTATLAIAISIIVTNFFRVTIVNGASMDNTLFDGQKLILNVRAYEEESPEYKDIVVVDKKDLNVQFLIKRIIGVPGDVVEIKNNELYINDELIVEDYIKEQMDTDDLRIEVPNGHIFVMGDNRNNSLDSRNLNIIGLIKDEDIYGKAVFNLNTFKTIK